MSLQSSTGYTPVIDPGKLKEIKFQYHDKTKEGRWLMTSSEGQIFKATFVIWK